MSGPEAIEDVFPCTAAQQGFVLGSLSHPEDAVFLEQACFPLQGRLDPERLSWALAELIRRHDVLRTGFALNMSDEPRQVILAEAPLELEMVAAPNDDEAVRRLRDEVLERHRAAFDLARPPLLRLTLIRRAEEDQTTVVWTHHHAILDGWSQMRLIEEMVELYNGVELDQPARCFGEYAIWLRERDTDALATIWREALAGFEGPPPLPPGALLDGGSRFATVSRSLAVEERTRLREFCSEHDLTLATVVSGCWGLVMAHLRSTADVAIGVTVSGRSAAFDGAAELVGPCASTVPLRIETDDVDGIVDWLRFLQGRLAEAIDNGDCSPAEIREWASQPPARPIYDSVMALANYPTPASAPDPSRNGQLAVEVEGLTGHGGRTLHPLALVVSEFSALELRLTADRARVDPTLAAEAVKRLAGLLGSLRPGSPSPTLTAMREQLAGLGRVEASKPASLGSTVDEELPAIERAVAASFAAALGLRRVGPDDDLIALGGHSMLAIELLADLRETQGVDLTLVDLVEAATPRRIAARIRDLSGEALPAGEKLPASSPEPDAAHEPFELTEMQRAYWVGRGSGFNLGEVDSRIFAAVDVERLDLPRLERAWRKLVLRHPALRTVLTEDGMQVVLPQVPEYEIAATDLRDAGEAREAELTAIRGRLSAVRGEPTRWPLFAIEAALLPGGVVRLFLSFDLLIGDALSWRILYRELRRLYDDSGAELPALELTFRDYVRALGRVRDTDLYRRSKRYWLDRLDRLPDPPQLPLARGSGELKRTVFERHEERFDRDSTLGLRELARRLGVTSSVLLLTSFVEVLRLYAESPEMLVNLTLYNRLPLHPQVEDVVGDFTSSLLVETSDGSGDFAARARALQRQLWLDLDHRHFSGIEVMRELRRARPHLGAVGAPVVFTSTLDLRADGPPLVGDVVDGLGQTPQVSLDCQVYELVGCLVLIWDAVADLYPEGMLERAFELHVLLLRGLANGEDAASSRRPLDIVRGIRPSTLEAARGGERLLHEPFLERARATPDAIAAVVDGETLTYGEALARANATVAALATADPSARPAGVLMEKGLDQVVAVLSVLLSGRPFVPIDPAWPPKRIETVARRAGIGTVLARGTPVAGAPLPEVPVVEVDRVGPGSADFAPTPVAASDPAYVIFTSGSSGEPKGVTISHRAALNTVLDVNDRFEVGPEDRILNLSALTFDLSIYDLFGALAAGGTVILPGGRERRDPPSWARLVEREGITVWNSVPMLMELLLGDRQPGEGPSFSSLRLCLLSGDWVPPTLPARIRDHAPNAGVVALGGATEGSIWSIAFEVGEVDPEWASIPYGFAMRGQSVEVLDGAFQRRPEGVPGEIFIGGEGVALGYVDAPEETATAFVEKPGTGRRLYRTGDWGRYRADGSIELLGRRDNQTKVNGHRIELPEIEAAILSLAGVRQAAVVTSGDRWGRRLEAFVVGDLDEAELRKRLAATLPAHMIPADFHLLESLPLSTNGKVDRGALGALVPTVEAKAPLAMPGELVGEIAEIASGFTGSPADRETDLLVEGLSSVEVIRLLNEVERRFGVRPDIEAFYSTPTPEAIAGAVARAAGSAPEPGSSSPWSGHPMIAEAKEREAFRRARPRFPEPPAQRLIEELDPLDTERRRQRRSPLSFAADLVPARTFGELLDCLRRVDLGDRRSFLYPSAGGLYSVDAWVAVRCDRVEGVPGGIYRYHPDAHDLIPLGEGIELGPELHLGSANDAVAGEAAFTILLGSDPADSAPLYGEEAHALNLLNAGYIGQLLCERALDVGLGLCPLQGFDFEAVRWLFDGSGEVVLLHLLVGGIPAVPREADR